MNTKTQDALNNRHRDLLTQSQRYVARLFNAAKNFPERGIFRSYMPGVGTPFPQLRELKYLSRAMTFVGRFGTRIIEVLRSLFNARHRLLPTRRTHWRLLALMCAALALAGCDQPTAVSVAAPPHADIRPNYGPSNPAGISGLNYTTYYIAGFSITDADGYTGGGPNIYPSQSDGEPAGGGAEMCCVMVPKKWHKDMTVTVRWERDTHPDDHQNRTGDQWLKAVATIPPYTSLTHGFWVRFLSNDRIVVQVNDQEWYIPKPIANQDAYVVQGVLDKTITKETQQ